MTAAEREAAGQRAFESSIATHVALFENPTTADWAKQFAGKDYGALAGGDGVVASILHKADLAGFVEKLPEWERAIRADQDTSWEKRVKDEIEPAVERRVRATVLGEAPPPDVGSGGNAGDDAASFIDQWNAGVLPANPANLRRAMQITGVRL